MALPVIKVKPPSALAGVDNGRVPPGVMRSVAGAGGRSGAMLDVAAAGWGTLVSRAAADLGVTLTASSSGDFYRSLAAQEDLFRSRYKPAEVNVWLPGRKKWLGVWWVKKDPKLATAAVPGTSNHGWGLAVDIAEWHGGPRAVGVSARTVEWLSTVGVELGWSAELQSEPWHWRWVAGDVPAPPPPVQPVSKEDLVALTAIGSACKRLPNGRMQVYDAHPNEDGTWTVVGQNGAPMKNPTGPPVFGNAVHTIPKQTVEFRGLVPARDHGGVIATFGQGITHDILA